MAYMPSLFDVFFFIILAFSPHRKLKKDNKIHFLWDLDASFMDSVVASVTGRL